LLFNGCVRLAFLFKLVYQWKYFHALRINSRAQQDNFPKNHFKIVGFRIGMKLFFEQDTLNRTIMNPHKFFSSKIAVAFALTALLFTFGCLDDDDNDDNTMFDGPLALVSLYNASPNSPGLDIEVDGNQINFNSFDYADYSGYLRFFTGTRDLRLTPHSANNSVFDTTVVFEEDKVYSIFVADEYDDISLLILNDNDEPASTGKAKVRLVNLSPDAGTLDLTVDGDADIVANGLSFKDASEFKEIDEDSYNFVVRDASNDEILLNLPDVDLRAGYFYTIIVRGYETPPNGNSNFLSGQVVLN
jgi:hypothetical protein